MLYTETVITDSNKMGSRFGKKEILPCFTGHSATFPVGVSSMSEVRSVSGESFFFS